MTGHGDRPSSMIHFYCSSFLLLIALFGGGKTPNDLVQCPNEHARQNQRDQHLLTARIGKVSVRPGPSASSDQVRCAGEGDCAQDDSGKVWQATGGLRLMTALHQTHMRVLNSCGRHQILSRTSPDFGGAPPAHVVCLRAHPAARVRRSRLSLESERQKTSV